MYVIFILTCIDVQNVLFIFVDTFDTQNVNVEPKTGGIRVEVIFINGTSAMGSFIVTQCQKAELDHYRSMDRNNESDVISLPYMDTGYRVLVYDLEKNGLPSKTPAYIEEEVNFDPAIGTCK